MTSFKQSLDKYLTQEPPDDFTPFVEAVYEAFSDAFYEKIYASRSHLSMPSNRFENSPIEDKWLGKCFSKGYEPKRTAEVIERAFGRYAFLMTHYTI